ncbi:hypothetical protein J5N97_023924 [Dioscorea zingiberensis]|uniref:Uncharacterized protein n=1 Tax=Dioscorea zingiberensis TaxID=325984 RepID=A0A9D5H8G0_9LILI|nr:hypothetical protein J5N97_023924 [Dioscorea zingiberensis]
MESIVKDQSGMNSKRTPQINRGIVSRSYGAPSSSHQGLFGSRPPPPNHASLPSSFPSSSPPLLPLPNSEPAIGIAIKPRDPQHQKKPRSASKRDDRWKRGEAPPQKPIEKTEDNGGAAVFDASPYSVSPPPSSLPLPRFSIMKPKPAPAKPAASCVAEAIGASVGADDGVTASDDLRRVLRL